MSADPSTTDAPGAATRLAVDVRRFPWLRPLSGDYAYNFAAVAPFYAGDPQSPDAWREALARVQAHGRSGGEVGALLRRQQERRDAPRQARDAAARLADSRTVAIVTGQQAGAFGGPAFTLLKAITAIQLARRVEVELRVPSVPVFWVDAEDHDWDEIAGCTVLDAQSQPRTVTLPRPEGAGELPVGMLRLGGGVEASLAELRSALTSTDFTDELFASLGRAYREGATVAEAFAAWLESVLGAHGLVVFDSSDVAVKPLVARVFARELGEPGRTAALATEAGVEMQRRGHSPQVVPQPDSVCLFRLDGARRPIRRQSDGFVVGEMPFSAALLTEEAETSPHKFSPNVLLRPIVQDTLFPTLCYVAGPSELAYLGQLRRVYDHFGLPMPLVHPRATATLVDSATARFLGKYDVPLEDLQPQDDAALNRLLASHLPPIVDAAMSDAQAAIRGAMERVIDAVPALDPTLAGAARTTLGKIEHELRSLQGKIISAAKRRDETLRRQFTRAQSQTFPGGKPQERAIASIYFLNLYGPALVDRLLQELPLDVGQHWVLSI